MSASDYSQLTVAQLQAWGTASITALQAATKDAEAQAGAGTITDAQMESIREQNNAQIDALTNGSNQLTAYAQQAFAAGAGN